MNARARLFPRCLFKQELVFRGYFSTRVLNRFRRLGFAIARVVRDKKMHCFVGKHYRVIHALLRRFWSAREVLRAVASGHSSTFARRTGDCPPYLIHAHLRPPSLFVANHVDAAPL